MAEQPQGFARRMMAQKLMTDARADPFSDRPKLRQSEPCTVCQTSHDLHMGTWVILATGALVCANDCCWREAMRIEMKGKAK